MLNYYLIFCHLLQRLFEWGVQVDCYLSMWQDPSKRLSEKVRQRVAPYVANIYAEGIPQVTKKCHNLTRNYNPKKKKCFEPEIATRIISLEKGTMI